MPNRSKIPLVGLLVALCIVAVVRSKEQKLYHASPQDRAAALDCFLEHRGPGAIVATEFAPIPVESEQGKKLAEVAHKLGVPFENVSQQQGEITGLSLARNIVSHKELISLNSSGDYWKAFRKRFGPSTYSVDFSPVFFSPDGSRAVFLAYCAQDYLNSALGVVSVEKQDGVWTFRNYDIFLVS